MNVRIRNTVGVALALSGFGRTIRAQSDLTVSSPNKRTTVHVATREGHLFYSVDRDNRALLLPSQLGFEFRSAPPLRDSLRITGSTRATRDTVWTQPWGEVARVREHYNELR